MTTKKLNHIYVINVKKFTQRRAFMEKQLATHDLKAEFIFDYDAEEITEEIINDFFIENTLSIAEKSCAMKHVKALQLIANTTDIFNLVLEDDAVFGKAFSIGLNHALAQSQLFSEYKVIYIGSGNNVFTPKSQRQKGKYLYSASYGRFADSYIIDYKTAKKRLAWIMKNKISEPIDCLFDRMDKEMGIEFLWLEDPIIEQGSKNGLFSSQLQKQPHIYLQMIFFHLKKFRRKYIYQLWR